jgi:hypothetical protein
MSNAYNLSSVSLANNKSTAQNKYFNNYFVTPNTISSNQNDAVVAYFQQVTGGNKQSAAILASTVIYTAMSQGVDPMSIVQQFQALKPGELNVYLAMFLNLNRVGTSLVGVNNQATQNKYITRAILA